jgi:hypothetical protein
LCEFIAEAPSINAEMARLLEIDKQKRKEANQKLKGQSSFLLPLELVFIFVEYLTRVMQAG